MAGRKAPAKRAEPKPVDSHRYRRRLERQPITAMSQTAVGERAAAKDVVKLIDCLTEWTRELQAAHSVAPAPSPNQSPSRSRGRRRVSTVSLASFYPRGNPLTQSMELRDRNGAVWLVYIEGAERPVDPQQPNVTVLPDRHLRFDSATESRFTSHVPAGSPFLAEARLQSLLDESQPDLPSPLAAGSPARTAAIPAVEAADVSGRSVASDHQAVADWSGRWERRVGPLEALRRHVLELLSGAANSMHVKVELLLGHRPARP